MDAELDGAVAEAEPVTDAADTGADTYYEGIRTSDVKEDFDLLNEDDTPEEKPAEEAAPEVAAEEKPAESAKAEAEPAEEVPATVKALRDALDKSPAIKTELEKNPQLRNMVYANARRSQELTTYKEQFATPELAKYAREGAEDLAQIEGMFFGKSPAGYEKLIQKMADVSADGQLEGFFTHHRQEHFWPTVIEYARQQGAEDVVDAVERISEFLGDMKAATPQRGREVSNEQDQLPAHVQKRLAKLDTLERQQGTQTEQATQEYEKGVVEGVVSSVRTQLKARVSSIAPALSEQAVEKVIDDTLRDINSVAGKDGLYQNKWTSLLRKANGSADAKTQLVNMATNYAKGVAGPIIQKHVNVFGSAAVKASAEKTAKLTTQKAKSDIKGAGGPNTPTRQGDVHALVREGRQLSHKLFGRDLKDMEILNIEETVETFSRMAKQRGK